MAEPEIVDLSTLNAKQKGKEYKATQKDVKSKDLVVKGAAMKKLQDVRYYTEGGCLVPLINSSQPKKKTMDVTKICHDQLLKFVDTKQDEAIIAALQLTNTSEGNLFVLKVLSDTLAFREEIKKPKKKKVKNAPPEEEEVIPEDPMYETLRRGALKSLYCIMRPLHGEPERVKDIQKAFAAVPDLSTQLVQTLLWLKKDITSEQVPVRVKAIQDGIYALMLLVFTLRHNSEAALQLCKSDLLAVLPELAAEKKFTLYCIQLLQLLSTFKEGIAVLNNPSMQALLMTQLEGAAKALSEPAEEAPAANAKAAKKEPPKKGAPAEVAEDPMDKLDCIVVTPQRSAVAVIKLISKVYIAIASQQNPLNPTIDPTTVRNFSAIVSKAVLSPVTHDVIRSAHQAPLDEPLGDSVDVMCIAVGTFGPVSVDARKATYESGALSAMMTVLLTSQAILSGPPPAPPAGGKGAPPPEPAPVLTAEEQAKQRARLVQMRRVAEKAVLNLVTESLESPLDDAQAGHVSHGIHLPVRWTSCFARKTDDATFDAGDATLSAKVVDMLSVANDEDLANRGVRILAAILHGHHHPVELIESKGLHKTMIKPLSQLVQSRGLALAIAEMTSDIRAAADAARARVQAAASAAEVPEPAGEAAVADVTDAMALLTVDSAGAVTNEAPPKEDVLIPSVAETFFLALSVVELFLMTTPETINAFTTTERVEMLADLLRVLGPVSNTDSTRASCGIADRKAEFEAVLHDPRRHNWSSLNPSSYCDNALVRPLILDVLSLTAAAGQKYRTFDGELPAPPCEPVPPSQSACEEASLITARYSADACCTVLMSQSDLCWTPSPNGVHLNVRPSKTRCLSLPVQDAAVSLLHSIATCGARGVAGAVGAIASSGFAFAAANLPDIALSDVDALNMSDACKKTLQGRCSMRDLLGCLRSATQPEATDGNFGFLVPAGFAWKRPAFFDEVFSTSDVLTVDSLLPGNPQIWPLIPLCGAFIGTLANPVTSAATAARTLDALSAAVRVSVLHDHSQPVITDVVAATFLCLGGGVALSGLLGRFGNVSAELKPAGMQLAYYLFNRGHSREAFWKDWELSHREEVVLDPKTGKPIVKKDDKKAKDPKVEKKKDPKAPAEVPPAVPDLELNFESTEVFPDPNHGPKTDLWVKLIDVFADDLHEHCPASTALISAVQGTETELSVFLINQGAAVDHFDGARRTALMYALLLSNNEVVEALAAKKANFDLVDGQRNPTVKYAILSLGREDMDRVFCGHLREAPSLPIEMYGHPTLLQTLLHTSMDFKVAGPLGLSPIMMALGLGELSVYVGGYPIHVVNASYNSPHASIEQVRIDVDALIQDGANVNFCNLVGQVPLHIAAARGDVNLMELLLSHGAISNALDEAGFLPLHYLAACCPENAVEGFDLLFKHSSHRHLERMEFNDYRTGAAQEAKDSIELERFLNDAFAEATLPSVIAKRRLGPSEILHLCTDANMSLLQLCFSAPVLLGSSRLGAFITNSKDRRMELALHMISTAEKVNKTAEKLLTLSDAATGFTTLHAATLLFQGLTPQIYLTEREKRAKRVRKFVSNEARLLDSLYAHIDPTVFNSTCSVPLPQLGLDNWTLLHPPVFWDNPELVTSLLQKGVRVDDTEIVHFLAEKSPTASEALVRAVMEAVVASPRSKALLNDVGTVHSAVRPLHLAVRTRNLNVVRALATSVKVDLNALDEGTERTALYEACELGALNLVQAFIPGADRLDLFAGNSNNATDAGQQQRTPLNVALDVLDVHLVQELVFMRKNDVIQQLLQISAAQSEGVGEGASDDTARVANTLLCTLEKQNAELARKLGLNVPPVDVQPAPSVKVVDAVAGSKGSVRQKSADSMPGETLSEVNDSAGGGVAEERNGDAEVNDDAAPSVDGNLTAEMAQASTEAALEDLDVIEQSGIGGKAMQDRKRTLELFRKSNEVLRVLIELVNGSGIVGESDHFHPYYFAGTLVEI